MFVLRVTYLTGRVYSAVLEEGDAKATPEWPPHPSRLFSALVAAWGEGGGEAELDRALQWLEAQPAPVIYAGDCSPRKLVQAFVPVNDVRSLPDDRPRKPRTFPSASLSRPDVYFVWRTEPPTEIASALDRVLRGRNLRRRFSAPYKIHVGTRERGRRKRPWFTRTIIWKRADVVYRYECLHQLSG